MHEKLTKRINYLQEFDDVAGAEHSMCGGELERFGGRKIRREHAATGASPAEDLASCTRAVDDGRMDRRFGQRGGRRERRGSRTAEGVTRVHG